MPFSLSACDGRRGDLFSAPTAPRRGDFFCLGDGTEAAPEDDVPGDRRGNLQTIEEQAGAAGIELIGGKRLNSLDESQLYPCSFTGRRKLEGKFNSDSRAGSSRFPVSVVASPAGWSRLFLKWS